MRRALPLFLAVLALGVALAGCGGAASIGKPLGDAAEVAPASAQAFAVLRTDGDAEATRDAIALLQRFPAIREYELDLEADVLPALGDEVALVALPGRSAVVLARPDDRQKLDALLARIGERHVTRERDGWTLLAEDEAALDAFEREREQGVLADDEKFQEEFGSLPEDALAKVWSSERQERMPGVAAAVFADDDGFRFEGSLGSAGDADAKVDIFEPQLLDRVPAGASLVVSFHGRDGLAAQMQALPIPPGFGFEALGEVLEGEGVLYLRQAMLIPEVTLLTQVEDEEAAAAAVAKLLAGFGVPSRADGQGAAGRVTLGPVTLSYAARDGVLAVTTGAVDAALAEADDSIADDPRFEQAAERAGLPDESGGFLYLRIDDLVPLLSMLGGMQGGALPEELTANLAPLRTLFVHAGRDGDRSTFAGTLELSR